MGRGRREKVSKGRGQARRNVVEEEANEGERRENIKMGNEEGSGEREEKKARGGGGEMKVSTRRRKGLKEHGL